MSVTYRVWQVGWEGQVKVVAFEEEPHCVACAVTGQPPAGADVVVLCYQREGSEEIVTRHLDWIWPLGIYCTEATVEQIRAARELADNIRAGRIQELRFN